MDTVQGMQQDAAVEAEKMLPQSQVTDLVNRERAAAAEKARRAAEEQYQAQIMQMQQQQAQAQAPQMQQQGNGDESRQRAQMEKVASDYFSKMQADAEEAQQRAQMEKVANDYYSKMNSVKEKYPDFDAVMSDFNPSSFPEIVLLASSMDNAGDVMYELAKKPEKVASILQLAQRDQNLARKALGALAGSISQNEQAMANNREAPAPLSRQKPSTGGVDNSEYSSISDFKNADWLRG